MNNEERKELAISKGLIIGDDSTIYNKVLNKYRDVLQRIINEKVDFTKFDYEIDNSNLYFSESESAKKAYNSSVIESKFFYFDSELYIEMLSNDDIKTITSGDEERITEIVKQTYPTILLNPSIDSEYYLSNENETIANGSLILKLTVGLNKEGFTSYIETRRKQNDFINEYIKKVETELTDILGIPCKIIYEKMV